MRTTAVRRKSVELDQRKLSRARSFLGTKTDAETVNRAIDFVVAEAAIDAALRATGGKGRCGKCSAEMRRIVVDTNLYVDWLNARQHESVLFQRDAVKYLSAVVVLELRAGAFSTRDRRLLDRMVAPFAKAGRILLPTVRVYEEAGNVLSRLQAARGYDRAGAAALVNDVLIALSARSIGATVITQNASDFRVIQTVRPFQLEIVS